MIARTIRKNYLTNRQGLRQRILCVLVFSILLFVGSVLVVNSLADHGDVAGAQGVYTRAPVQEDFDRCLRERAEYDQQMSEAWRRIHPGQVVPHP